MPTLEFTTRPAQASDAPCLSALGAQVFLDTYATEGLRPSLVREVNAQFTPEIILALLRAPDTRVILAERNAHLIGFVQFEMNAPSEFLPGVTAAKVNRLYVQERFTGTGVGKALLELAERDAAAEGARAIWLTAWVGNSRALKFYPLRGYADIGLSIYEFENERHENRVFARHL